MNERDQLQDHMLAARVELYNADVAIALHDSVAALSHLEHAIEHWIGAVQLVRAAAHTEVAKSRAKKR